MRIYALEGYDDGFQMESEVKTIMRYAIRKRCDAIKYGRDHNDR